MAVKIPIHERVTRQLLAELVAALPAWMDEEIEAATATAADKAAAVAERLDPLGNDPGLFCPVLIEGPAGVSEGGDGDDGIVTYEAEYVVQVFLPAVEGSAVNHAAMQQRWVARFEAALPKVYDLAEAGTGESLATDVVPVGHDTPVRVKDKRVLDYVAEAAFEVHFDTYRANPYQGPGNTERTE
jgi:hypothetical protein